MKYAELYISHTRFTIKVKYFTMVRSYYFETPNNKAIKYKNDRLILPSDRNRKFSYRGLVTIIENLTVKRSVTHFKTLKHLYIYYTCKVNMLTPALLS